MKILALSDVHGAYAKMVQIVAAHPAVDVIIVAGDLTTYGSRREAEDAIHRLQSFGKPVFVVAGNMDPPELDELFVALGVSLNARGVVYRDVGFFGVSAAPLSPLHTPNEISETEIAARAEAGWRNILHAKEKVFVPHAPPFTTTLDVTRAGKHVGSAAVRTFIEKHQPDVTICGHIHEARGTDTIGATRILNCGPAADGCFGVISLNDSVTITIHPAPDLA
jgi:hypothetical protein